MKNKKKLQPEEVIDIISKKSDDLQEKIEVLNNDLDKTLHRSPSKAILSWRLIKLRKRQTALKKEYRELKKVEKKFGSFLDKIKTKNK